MRCNSCGNEIPNGSKMCPFCNAVIEDGTQNFNESENLNTANDVVNANQSTTNAVNGEKLGNVENELPIANEEIERVNNLNQGDYILAKVQNTNITMGTNLKNFFYSLVGKDTIAIEASSSALVTTTGK